MIIELFGPVGSGKTTIAKQLRDNENFVVVKIDNKAELIWYGLKFYWRYPALGARMIVWFARSCQVKSCCRIAVSILLYRPAVYMKAKKIRKAVIDEGLRQNILSIFNREVAENEMEKYLQFLPPVDLLVGVAVAEAELEARLERRQKSFRRVWLSEDERKRWDITVRKNFAVMKNCLVEHDNFVAVSSFQELVNFLNNSYGQTGR